MVQADSTPLPDLTQDAQHLLSKLTSDAHSWVPLNEPPTGKGCHHPHHLGVHAYYSLSDEEVTDYTTFHEDMLEMASPPPNTVLSPQQ